MGNPPVGLGFMGNPTVGLGFRGNPTMGLGFRGNPTMGLGFMDNPTMGLGFMGNPTVGLGFRGQPNPTMSPNEFVNEFWVVTTAAVLVWRAFFAYVTHLDRLFKQMIISEAGPNKTKFSPRGSKNHLQQQWFDEVSNKPRKESSVCVFFWEALWWQSWRDRKGSTTLNIWGTLSTCFALFILGVSVLSSSSLLGSEQIQEPTHNHGRNTYM